MAAKRLGCLIGLLLVLGSAEPVASQERPDPTAFLSELVGLWQYVVRTPDGTELERGFRTFILASPYTLIWIDESSDGDRAEGQLRFVEPSDEFEYVFPGETGACWVRGRLVDGSSIRFGREGPCYAEVLESVLTVQRRDAHSYTYVNGALAIDFTRRPR